MDIQQIYVIYDDGDRVSQDQQRLSAKGRTVNISGCVTHTVSVQQLNSVVA